MSSDLIIICLSVGFGMLYLIERDKRLKAEAATQLVLKRKDLDTIGGKLDVQEKDYLESLNSFSDPTIPSDMLSHLGGQQSETDMSLREMFEATLQGQPLLFKGIAKEDLREGQVVNVEVDPAYGTTRVYSAAATPVFTGES